MAIYNPEDIEKYAKAKIKQALEELMEKLEGSKMPLVHFECREGKTEMCEICLSRELRNQVLSNAITEIKEMIV